MKHYLYFIALFLPTLSFASEDIPAVVKHFGEQQEIKNIKEIDAPGGVKSWIGQYQDMGVTLFLTPDGKHVISGYLYDDKGKKHQRGIFPEGDLYPARTRNVADTQ